MDRYIDNESPEPTVTGSVTLSPNEMCAGLLATTCYKTPEAFQPFQQFSNGQISEQIGVFYPTPPSDSDESSMCTRQLGNKFSENVSPVPSNTSLENRNYKLLKIFYNFLSSVDSAIIFHKLFFKLNF